MICAIVIIEPDATEKLTKVERIAENYGYPAQDVHGHITLASYTGDDEEVFISSCKGILSKHKRFPVYYDKIEAWNTTSGTGSFIVAIPRKEDAIVTIQKEIADKWSAYLNEWTQADAWNPHTFLLYVPGVKLDYVAEAMQEQFEPFVTQIERIEFTRVLENETGSSIEVVDFIELQKD